MSTALLECERIARDGGLSAGLAAALTGADVGALAPGRYAAVPSGAVPEGAEVRTHDLADREDIVFVACPGDRPATGYAQVELGRLLAAVRLCVLRALLDTAVEHLSTRTAGEEPLLRKQLVTGAVADISAGIDLLRRYAATMRDPDALGDLHTRLDELGWQVAELFGAAGYLAEHPGRVVHVSALVANTWIDRTGAP